MTSAVARTGHSLRWVRVVVTIGLLVGIVVGVVPHFASYSETWHTAVHIGPSWWLALGAATVVTQYSGIWMYQVALPGLRLSDAFVGLETTSAISSMPGGGPIALGMTYKMYSSFGFNDVGIATAITVTGVWNLAAKFILPVIAVGLLALTSHPPRVAVAAASAGALVTVALGLGIWLIFRSEAIARWFGGIADKAVNKVRTLLHRPADHGIEQAFVDVRVRTVHTVHHRGWRLTAAVLGAQLVGIALILLIVRSVGISPDRVSPLAVLTSFSVARFAGSLPITPGGLGTIDSAFVGTMAAFGATTSRALAADLIWRMTTYLIPILIGIVTYLIWIRREAKAETARPPDPFQRR